MEEDDTQEEENTSVINIEDCPDIDKYIEINQGYIKCRVEDVWYYVDTYNMKAYEITGYLVSYGVYINDSELINYATGEVLATNVYKTYPIEGCGNARKLLLVEVKEESFDGTSCKFGIINTKTCEWVAPIGTYEIINDADPYINHFYGGLGYIFTYRDANGDDRCINMLTGEDVTTIFTTEIYAMTQDNILAFNYSRDTNSLFLYNNQTKEKNIIAEDYDILLYPNNTNSFVRGNLVRVFSGNSDVTYYLFDENLNIVDVDLSEYDIVEYLGMSDTYIVFTANNPAGVEYLIALDKNGNRVLEPIEDPYDVRLMDNGIVYQEDSGSNYYFIDNSGNESSFNADEIFFHDLDTTTGMTYRKIDGKYYLININDYETLLHPYMFLAN